MLSYRETGRHVSSVNFYSAIPWCSDAVFAGVSVSKPGTWPAWVDVESCLWDAVLGVAMEAYCCARISKQKTERKRTTRRLGAVLTYKPAAVTEDVIRHSCLPFTVIMLLLPGLPVESDGSPSLMLIVATVCDPPAGCAHFPSSG